MKHISLSIIIVTLNRINELIKCVNSIYNQDIDSFEIIIIDNNSSDQTSSIIKNKFPNIRVYKTMKNLGTSYTRNAAINLSNGEKILFLDSDVYIKDNNTLSNMINKLDNNIHVLGGEAIISEQNTIIGKKRLKLYENGMVKGFIDNEKKMKEVDVLATCNLLTKKKYLEDVGGFDHYFFFYLEDIDLTYRMKKKGYKLFVIDECKIVHYFSQKNRFNNYFKSSRNRVYFLIKNFKLSNVLLLPINDLLYLFDINSFKKFYNKLIENRNSENYRIKKTEKNFSFFNLIHTLNTTILLSLSLIFSYMYIPYYLLLNKDKKNRKNFLNLINLNDFIEIEQIEK